MKRRILIALAATMTLFTASVWGQTIPIVAEIDSTGAGTGSGARGTFFGAFDPATKNLTYQITVNKLQGPISAAHFHDENTAILQGITFTGNTATGTWTNIHDSLLVKLVDQRIYVNVHTSVFPGGEIRGFTSARAHAFGVKMDGAQAGQTSNGKGTGFVTWDSTTTKVGYHMTYAGLNAPITAAHFHSARTTAVVQGITFTDSSASGSWTVPDTLLHLLIKGELYVNIHTSFATGGEIRGEVVPYGELSFRVAIDGAQAGTASNAKGTAWVVLDRFATKVKYHMTYASLGSAFTAAHFHQSPGGGIIQGITFTGNVASGEWAGLTDTNLRDLLKGNLYINIHSVNIGSGEIRGNLQYTTEEDAVWTAALDGAQASTSSTGRGTAWLSLYKDDSVKVRVTIAGLTSPFSAAHVHATNTGVIFGINFTDSTGTAVAQRSDSLLFQLIKGGPYVNVHSTAFGGGEIRGNLKLGSGVVTSVERTSSTVPASFELRQNYPNPFNPVTFIDFSIRKSGRVSLKVYNLLGQQVATLVDGMKEPGSYKVTFDAARLTSGVYFYRLQSENGFVETRKMILVK